MKKFLVFLLLAVTATLLADWGASNKAVALARYGG